MNDSGSDTGDTGNSPSGWGRRLLSFLSFNDDEDDLPFLDGLPWAALAAIGVGVSIAWRQGWLSWLTA